MADCSWFLVDRRFLRDIGIHCLLIGTPTEISRRFWSYLGYWACQKLLLIESSFISLFFRRKAEFKSGKTEKASTSFFTSLIIANTIMENSNNLAERIQLPNILNRSPRPREPSRRRVDPQIPQKRYMILQKIESGILNANKDPIDVIPTWDDRISPEFDNDRTFFWIKNDIDKEHRPSKEELSRNVPVRYLPPVTVSTELLDVTKDYNVEVYKHPYVVIQHDPSAKEQLTDVFRKAEHTIIHTDSCFTGMLWNEATYTSLLDHTDGPGVQFIFLPFTMRRWTEGMDEEFLLDDGIYSSVLNFEDWCFAVMDKFWNRELFGTLSVWDLRVGIRVECSGGREATEQAMRLKNEICWVLQFKALQQKLHWRVNYYTNDAECDITLVVTISDRCMMTGIQVRRPQDALPENQTSLGLSLMWPFLHAAKLFTCVDVPHREELLRLCILWHNDNLAAFYQFYGKNIATNGFIECWKPLTWSMKTILAIWDRERPSRPDRDTQISLEDLQCLLRRSQLIQRRRSTDETITSRWIV